MIASLVSSPRFKWYAFAAMAVGIFASVVDHGSVNIALPTVADDFSTDLPTVQWVVIAYTLTISALLHSPFKSFFFLFFFRSKKLKSLRFI